MNLLAIIRAGVDKLPEGDHVGLLAVVNHIEVAIRHLEFGQASGDAQLFTDAVYRCNQAFEGSVKELYRVVAGKDANTITPYKIEAFFEESNILRPKVLNQLKRYRQEWRNPSTHDYTLDFDEDEAFLAIVNIAAFAQTAVSQIASKLAFDIASQSTIKVVQPSGTAKAEKIAHADVSEAVAVYAGVYLAETEISQSKERPSEGQVASMLAGFFSSINDTEVTLEAKIAKDRPFYADILVSRGKDRCVVELRSEKSIAYHSSRGIDQLKTYMEVGSINSGVLVVYADNRQPYCTLTSKTLDDKTLQLVVPQSIVKMIKENWSEYNFTQFNIK